MRRLETAGAFDPFAFEMDDFEVRFRDYRSWI